MGIMKIASRLWGSRSSTAMALTVIAIAVAVILLASNFTIINAQQQQQSLTSQSGEIENRRTTATGTTFQSTNDSFSVQVPQGWVIQDLNNTGSSLLEESTRGYGLLAQLCPEEQQQQQQVAPPTNATGGTTTTNSSSDAGGTSNCQGTQEVIYIIRYPDLDTRIQAASNVTTATPTTTTSSSNNNNMTTDNVLSYHLQKLQEVGYRSIQIVKSTELGLNLTNPQTNETIATVPSRLVEIAYSTNSAPNEIRTGYFISTATNATAPNLGTTKGYAVFYEGNSTTSTAPAIQTTTAASGSLAPTLLSPAVGQVFDSFELIAAAGVAPEAAQAAAEIAEGGDDGANDDDDDGANDDDDDGANDDDDDGANDDD
ncbi:MAG: hypothetical protein ACJ70M_05565, partial [Nitrososphaera sp.]